MAVGKRIVKSKRRRALWQLHYNYTEQFDLKKQEQELARQQETLGQLLQSHGSGFTFTISGAKAKRLLPEDT